ncbi:MAG: macro domain-containing protein [Bacteroidota bacterium]
MIFPHNNIQIELVQGDITKQSDITAIVNAANAELLPGGGVAGAIHRAAGPELEMESHPLGPVKPGEAVITKGYNLPNEFVIHSLGPVYGLDKPEDKFLAACYQNALQLADEKNIESIAFPAISTGAFGFPIKPAAEISLKAIREMMDALKQVKMIRMVLFSDHDLDTYEQEAKKVFN